MELKKLSRMREVGQIVSYILKILKEEIRVGQTGQDLEKRALQLMKEKKVRSSIKNYRGFPAAICVSLNDELTHGVPSNRPFQQGDLVSIDVACHKTDKWKNTYHADAALTTIVGEEKEDLLNQEKKKILMVTQNALQKVIENIKPGITTTQDIGNIVEEYVHSQGYYAVKEYGGHGIGENMHEKPFIPNYLSKESENVTIKKNTAICVEPLVQAGNADIKLSPDNWTVLSSQGQLNAHFEHTIWIGEEEVEVLTK